MTTIYTNRKTIAASDTSLYELAIRSAHVLIITDPTRSTWYAIGRHGKAAGTELPKAEWISCPIIDISPIDEKHDELVAKIMEDCTSPMIGVTDISGLIRALTGLGAGIAHIHNGQLIVARNL